MNLSWPKNLRPIWIVSLLPVLATGVILAGCMRYSFSGAVPSHLKTVAVPLVENQTAEYGVAEKITDEVVSRIQQDNTLKIADENAADAVLRGTLVRVDDVPYTYSETGQTQGQNFNVGEYKLTLVVKVQYYDQVEKKVIWEREFSNWGTYNHTTGSPEERQQGFDEAISKLAEDILNQTVSGW